MLVPTPPPGEPMGEVLRRQRLPRVHDPALVLAQHTVELERLQADVRGAEANLAQALARRDEVAARVERLRLELQEDGHV